MFSFVSFEIYKGLIFPTMCTYVAVEQTAPALFTLLMMMMMTALFSQPISHSYVWVGMTATLCVHMYNAINVRHGYLTSISRRLKDFAICDVALPLLPPLFWCHFFSFFHFQLLNGLTCKSPKVLMFTQSERGNGSKGFIQEPTSSDLDIYIRFCTRQSHTELVDCCRFINEKLLHRVHIHSLNFPNNDCFQFCRNDFSRTFKFKTVSTWMDSKGNFVNEIIWCIVHALSNVFHESYFQILKL